MTNRRNNSEEGAHPTRIAMALEHLSTRAAREERTALLVAAALSRDRLLPSPEEIERKIAGD